MKYNKHHPTYTAYVRDLQRELFVMDHGKEYGDNIFIDHRDGEKTTLAAIKIMAMDEMLAADPVSKLQDALEAMLKDPHNGQAAFNGLKVLRETKAFGKDWNE